jgi:cob(I)alamin adenosyltransferase
MSDAKPEPPEASVSERTPAKQTQLPDPPRDEALTDEPLTDDPRPTELRVAPSLVLVNTGDGKGKSSAAFGVMLRAVARDWRVAVVQFLKSGEWKTGEEKVGRKLGVDWFAIGEGFTWDSTDLTRDQAVSRQAWNHAKTLINTGEHRLVILDEITYPMNWGWIDTDDVIATISGRPSKVSIVATGRDAPQALIDVADTVTEMRNVKHAYETGIAAKKGIDY